MISILAASLLILLLIILVALLKVAERRVRFRFPPPIGHARIILQRLTMDIIYRRSRWMQLGLDLSQVVVACIADVAELRRLGYDARLIKRAFHCSISSDSFYVLSL